MRDKAWVKGKYTKHIRHVKEAERLKYIKHVKHLRHIKQAGVVCCSILMAAAVLGCGSSSDGTSGSATSGNAAAEDSTEDRSATETGTANISDEEPAVQNIFAIDTYMHLQA
ncbi:MAG: hypothetical protein LUF92_17320 [Clostridiales bacterium]|nr:hypothetical protein [Clostridiales bacterium]